MHFNIMPQKNSTSPRKSNDPVTLNFRLPPPLNISIPKNNVGAHQNDKQTRPADLIGLNPDNGTYSPIPQHHPPSNYDCRELSFGFDMFLIDDNMPEKVSISTQNPHTQRNKPRVQNTAKKNDNMFNQLTSIFNYKTFANNPNNPHQGNTLAQIPTHRNTDGPYPYDSLEHALNVWISRLKVGKKTKSVYKSRIIKFVRLLDSYGFYNPSPKQIEDYCNIYFRPDDRDNIRYFNMVSRRFFEWIEDSRIYAKIRPHTNTAQTTYLIND